MGRHSSSIGKTGRQRRHKASAMQFGLFYLPTSVTDDPQEAARRYREMLDQVAYAEELDFRSVWLAEHHFHPFGGMFSAPVAIGAAIAERCSRIRIGTAVA